MKTLKGVIDPGTVDFNDDNKLGRGKDMVDRLTRLIAIFEDFDFIRIRQVGMIYSVMRTSIS